MAPHFQRSPVFSQPPTALMCPAKASRVRVGPLFRVLPALALLANLASCRTPVWKEIGPGREGGDYGSGSDTQNFTFNPTDRSCGGFPRLRIETMDKTCIGLVAQQTSGFFRPRVVFEIPGRKDEYLISDHANFSDTQGKIWYLKNTGDVRQNTLKVVINGLSLPHQIALGPGTGADQLVLFGESDEIRAFPLRAIGPQGDINASLIKTVVSGLPPFFIGSQKNSVHPISHFVLDDRFNLYVNVGSFSDHCSADKGTRCIESSLNVNGGRGGADLRHAGALIRRYDYSGNVQTGWRPGFRIVAQGLRNSMGLLFSANGDLIQVENARDFPESQRPYEELNVIPRASLGGEGVPLHYGWPYCYDAEKTSDDWKSFSAFDCTNTTTTNGLSVRYVPPYLLLPPHGSPLGILQYSGSALPFLQGKLLVSLHGYRPAGHRIVAFDLDTNPQSASFGLPVRSTQTATFRQDSEAGGTEPVETRYELAPSVAANETYTARSVDVVKGWYESPGVRPQGAPVGLTQVSDGSIWIADDKNRSILRLVATELPPLPAAPRPDFAAAYTSLAQSMPAIGAKARALASSVLRGAQCQGCHDSFKLPRDNDADGLAGLRYILSLGGWVKPGAPEESVLAQKLSPPGRSAMPPPDRPFPNVPAAERALADVRGLISTLPRRELLFQVKGETPLEFQAKGFKCGSLAARQTVAVVSRSAQTLGGKKVLQVLMSGDSPLITSNRSVCTKESVFFAQADSLEPLLQNAP